VVPRGTPRDKSPGDGIFAAPSPPGFPFSHKLPRFPLSRGRALPLPLPLTPLPEPLPTGLFCARHPRCLDATGPELPAPWLPWRPPPRWPRRSPSAGAAARWRGSRQGRGRAGALSCGAHWTPTSPTWALTVRNGALRRRVPSYLNSPCSLSVGRFEETRRLARLGLVVT
jgi:hypothetical protein